MGYILVDEKTGEKFVLGTKRADFRGDTVYVFGYVPPRHEGSTGRVWVSKKRVPKTVSWPKDGAEYYPSVYGLKIVPVQDAVSAA